MNQDFAHLRAHSCYSIAQGMMTPDDLVRAASSCGMTHVGLADTASISGIPAFLRSSSMHGIAPLPGIQIRLTDGYAKGEACLLALDEDGLRNLVSMHRVVNLKSSARGHQPAPEKTVWIDELDPRGLALLTGGTENGFLPNAASGSLKVAVHQSRSLLSKLSHLFGDRLYVELQRDGFDRQPEAIDVERTMIDAARVVGVPVVATNDPVYRLPEHRAAYNVLRTYRDMPSRVDERWFKDAAEMRALFKDLPQACSATSDLAARCRIGDGAIRVFMTAPRPSMDLRARAHRGLEGRFSTAGRGTPSEAYRTRLDTEMDDVDRLDASGHFQVAALLTGKAREMGSLVAPGCGHLAGSLTAWSLGITGFDPVAQGLTTDGLLGGARFSGFSLEVQDGYRDKLVEGRAQYPDSSTRAFRTSTFVEFKGLGLLRAVVSKLGCPGNKITKQHKAMMSALLSGISSQDVASARSAESREGTAVLHMPEVRRTIIEKVGDEIAPWIDLAALVESHPIMFWSGTHATDVAFGLQDTASGALSSESWEHAWTAFDRSELTRLGIPVISLLENRQLDLAAGICAADVAIDFESIPDDDAETFAQMAADDVSGIFPSWKSNGTTLSKAAPATVGGLATLLALSGHSAHRGVGALNDYVSRLAGTSKPKPPHPLLRDALQDTMGLMVFREQVMAIVGDVCALPREEMLAMARMLMDSNTSANARQPFMAAAIGNGHDEHDAEGVFRVLARFAPGTVNRTHAVGVAMLGYRMAWLRAHRAEAWNTAKLSERLEGKNAVKNLLEIPEVTAVLRAKGII